MAAECREHRVEYMRADDGEEIPVRVFGPDGEGTPLVMLHGIRSHSGWFTKSASFVASLGHPVYSFDRRGSGLSREIRGHITHFQTMIDEARTVAAAAMERHGKRRVHILGHCFGAIPAAVFACCHPDMVDSLILPTPGIHTWTTVAPLKRVQIAMLRIVAAAHSVPFPLQPEDLADLEADHRLIRDDPLSLHELTAGFCFESFRARRYLKRKKRRLTAPLFMALAAGDRISNNERNAAFFHSVPSRNKRLTIYPNATHILEFSHEKDAFFRDLAVWIGGGYNRRE